MKKYIDYYGYKINLLSILKLYVNGTWIDIKPLCVFDNMLVAKNVDTKMPGMTIIRVDLEWHFTTANGKQIKDQGKKLAFWDKIKFIARSNI